MCKIDLQPALGGPRARAEDFKNERGAIEDFGVPRLFKVPVLAWTESRVDNDQAGPRRSFSEALGDQVDPAGADQCRRPRTSDNGDFAVDDFEVNRFSEADRFFQPRFGAASPHFSGDFNMNYERRAEIAHCFVLKFAFVQARLFAFFAVPKVYRLRRHYSGYRMLIDELHLPFALQ